MKAIKFFALFVAITALVACNKGVDPKEVEAMKTENASWQAKLAEIQQANSNLQADYDAMKKDFGMKLGEKGIEKMMKADSTAMATKDAEVNGVVTEHTDLVNAFSTFLTENDTWLNELANNKTTTEEAKKIWAEKQAKGAEFVAKNDEIAQKWAGWKTTFETWAAENVTKFAGKK
jgi:hypothetical protein